MPWIVAGLLSLLAWAGILISVASVLADQTSRVGRAPLFLLYSRYDVREYLRSAPTQEHTIAILWDVPKRRVGNLSRVLARSPVDTVLIALLNETCVRNKVCESGDALAGYSLKGLRRAASRGDERLKAIVQREAKAVVSSIGSRLEGRRLLINPLLETSLSASQWDIVASWIEEAVGEVDLVWNPLRQDAERPRRAKFTEQHGFDVSCGRDGSVIANLDGSWGSVEHMRKWLEQTRRCRDSLLWITADNCRSEDERAFVPPSRRVCRQSFRKVKEALEK